MPDDPELVEHRRTPNNQVSMLFVHGFSGDPTKTWGEFPALLMGEKRLSGWDLLQPWVPHRPESRRCGNLASQPRLALARFTPRHTRGNRAFETL